MHIPPLAPLEVIVSVGKTFTGFDGVPYDPDHVHLRVDEVVTFQLPSQTKIQIRNWCVEDLAEVFDRDGSRQNTYGDIKPHK